MSFTLRTSSLFKNSISRWAISIRSSADKPSSTGIPCSNEEECPKPCPAETPKCPEPCPKEVSCPVPCPAENKCPPKAEKVPEPKCQEEEEESDEEECEEPDEIEEIDVPGLSKAVLCVPKGEVGPGASKCGKYKNPEYFSFHRMSYQEAEVEMSCYRNPQPNAKKKAGEPK